MKLLISIVHNYEVDRVLYLERHFEKLCCQFRQKNVDCLMHASSFQGDLKKVVSPFSAFISEVFDFLHVNKINKIKGNKARIIKNLFGLAMIFFDFAKKTDSKKRYRAIERSVTSKHIHATENFINSDADLLLIAESDLVFREDSIPMMLNLLEFLENMSASSFPFYLDVAGGYPLGEILSKSDQKVSENLFCLDTPITNTVCGYILNRRMASSILEYVQESPFKRLLGIDFLLNEVIFNLKSIHCYHMKSPPFNHGSFSGNYVSWTKEN